VTAADVLPPDPPEPNPTEWEQEHVLDPRDTADAMVELPGMPPPIDARAEYRARIVAEAERDYWRDQYDVVCAALRERDPRFRGGRARIDHRR
jgi:hypothetical protein